MIAHVSLYVKDYKKAKKLYAAALKPLGYKLKMDMAAWKAAGFMEGGHTSFWIVEKKRTLPGHIALLGRSTQAVDAFYKEARKNGGKDNGGPGFRTDYGPNYYAAFILD